MTGQKEKIAKNTLYLYIRMAVMMVVRLYTVRVVLQSLGIAEYGVWNVIMAFATAFTFISPTLVTASQRFLNYDMGQGGKNLRKIFVSSFLLFLAAILIVWFLLETFGLWFVTTRMNIPPPLVPQVMPVYQCCILTLLIDLLRMPYESVIVAMERMSFYAVICLFEAVILLGVVFLLDIFPPDIRLVAYGILTVVAHAAITGGYIIYTRRIAPFARIGFHPDRKLIREMAAFTGWSALYALTSIFALQGVDVLINVYFGVEANAAYGVATQVRTAVLVCITNIAKASSPGVVKDFAMGLIDKMNDLVMDVGKLTYFLILLPVIPAICFMPALLAIWLGESAVPPLAVTFSIPVLIQLLIVGFNSPMETAVMATGRISRYQLQMSVLIILNFIFSWIVFALGADAVTSLWIRVVLELLIYYVRILWLRRLFSLPVSQYFRRVIAPVIAVTAAAAAIMWLLFTATTDLSGTMHLITASVTFMIIYPIVVWFIGFNNSQRNAVLLRLKKYRT